MAISDQIEGALTERLSRDVIDVLVQHVEVAGSLDGAIDDFKGMGNQEIHLPGGKTAKASDLVRELKGWYPKHVRGDTTVYHSTTKPAAEFMLKNGVIPQMKPWTLASRRFASGKRAEFRPGAGVERGLYVGTSKSTSGFGPVTLAITVPHSWLEVPAELKTLGHKDPKSALETEHGALIRKPVHPRAIKKA